MKKIFWTILIFSGFLSGCNSWLDINTDPNNPSKPDIDKLLPGIYYDMGDDLGIGYDRLGYVCAVYTHQLTSREEIDQYGVKGSSYPITTYWSDLYSGPMQDIDLLITTATDGDDMIYAGIGKILKAYLFSQMVDLWGDIPYSEANKKNFDPAFDDQTSIYTDLFALLDEGISNLNDNTSENIHTPGSDDLIYAGSVSKWTRAAKSIKLKLYNQVQNTSMYDADAVNTLISDPSANLIHSGQDFNIPFGTSVAPDNRNPAFVLEYDGGQISNYISPWFFEAMNGVDNGYNIFNGIVDPRIPFYWVNQLEDGKDPENPVEYRYGDFVSIYFGSRGSHRDAAGRATFSMMGLYPCGGAYQDDPNLDRSSALGRSAGTGAAPYRMLTYADVLYIRAELAQVGKTSEDAETLLSDAMVASFEEVDDVAAVAGLARANIPTLSGSAEEISYETDIMNLYTANAGNSEKQLQIIMTEKWVQAFGRSIDSYTDYRRTGYPVMFDPNTMASVADGGTDGNGIVPVQASRGYPRALPYSADELSLNDNSPSQRDLTVKSIFWDK